MHEIHRARPGHARPDQTSPDPKIHYIFSIWHKWASDTRCEALDRCKIKDFSYSIDLEGSQGRFIGLKSGL